MAQVTVIVLLVGCGAPMPSADSDDAPVSASASISAASEESVETTTPTVSSPSPSEPDSGLRLPILVPAEVADRAELPWCGHEVVERTRNGDLYSGTIRDCFITAYEAGAPAEFVSDGSTIEGDRIREIYRTRAGGGLEVFIDSTADTFGSGGWTRTRCARIRPGFPDPTGVPSNLGLEDCGQPVVVAADPQINATPDELRIIESFIAFARAPGDEAHAKIPFTDEVALGLADLILERHPQDALTDPGVWVLDADRLFRGRGGPFSALDQLAAWDRNAGDMLVRELVVNVGSHPLCASAPVQAPPDVADLRRVSVQPIGPDTCTLWWSVDLYFTDDGRVAAITVDYFDP